MDKDQAAREAFKNMNQEQFILYLQVQIFDLQEKLVALSNNVGRLGKTIHDMQHRYD